MEHFTCDIDDHIATVTIQSKTMPVAFFHQCERVFRELADNHEVRAVVLRASGKVFSYGLDLPDAARMLGPYMRGGLAGKRMELRRKIVKLQQATNAIAECPVPVIAAVHNWCIGGGLDVISACDIRLASADAKISLRETRIAIVSDLGSLQRLPGIIGQGYTRELAYTGKDIDAQRAQHIGLINDIYPDRESVHAAADALAHEIAANPPLTVRGVKHVLDYSQDKSVEEGLSYVATWNAAALASSDLGEAMSAMVAKRKPVFKGE